MNKPTDEQQAEFWERCGLSKRGGYWWYDSHGKHLTADKPPPIDYNNLFRWAVPMAIDKIMAEQDCSSDLAYEILFKKWLQELVLIIPDAALALFCAIWKVMEGK